ncbi:MAG TPA: hypothetical protein DEB40_01245 [Elusimicrobia bacterium]|nr:hypothetical protein [Elusimicrobiota bacterium]HBT60355.1 hypothetical protein [Elusimicrobiota bacterium]
MGTRIVIVDDDPLVGGLTASLLTEAGYDVTLIPESIKGLEAIQSDPPALAILDIVMPGLDGLTICHRIKNDPRTKDVKVAMVSAKIYRSDRERAAKYGADIFIDKPYDVDAFPGVIAALLGRGPIPAQAEAPGQESDLSAAKLRVTVWGCRSLSAVNVPDRSRYGHRTPCVSLETGSNILIFDAGSGIIPLGKKLAQSGQYNELWLCLTHFHQDHFEGLNQFAPAYCEDFKINILGANDPDLSLQDRIRRCFETAPADLGHPKARLQLFDVMEESYEPLPGVRLSAFFANHPDTTLGLIVETEGRKVVYCPDSEIYGERATALQDYDERIGRLVRGADLLIHDGRYLDSDYQSRRNNGHSSWVNALELAAQNEVQRLILFHEDDTYSDDVLDRIETEAKELIARKNYAIQVMLARESLAIGF